jgi:hypothetical protein
MVEHLPQVPLKHGSCAGCGRPSRTAFCDACVSLPRRPFDPHPGEDRTLEPARVERHYPRRHNGRPMLGQS